MSAPDVVRVTTVVAVPPGEAFRIFTDEIDAWWGRGPRFRPGVPRGAGPASRMRFEPGAGGRLLEIYDDLGPDAFELGRVRTWEPPDRLVFSMGGRDFRPGEETRVEVRFEAAPGGTRVTVEHGGFEALAKDHPARRGLPGGALLDAMAVWWGDLLRAAQAYAAGRLR